MRVLLTNDDGYRADGIRAIARRLSEWADVCVVTPDGERSGSGHSITLHRPLRLTPIKPPDGVGQWHLVDGTPTDCVNLGINAVMANDPPDVVVAGINHGLNLGDDVTYSGTVGGALEGFIFGYRSVALSQRIDGDFDMERTAEIADQLIHRVVRRVQDAALLNVNFPTGELGDLEFTRLGRRIYRDTVQTRSDPRGVEYYWIAGRPEWDDSPGTDLAAVQAGRIAVTPLQLDLTDVDRLEVLEEELEEVAEEVADELPRAAETS